MIAKIRQARENEEGFTLIELLVVVIIIGILAAIAIPAFLNQRERAYQAEDSSTVRNVALEIEAEATKYNGDYTKVVATSGTGATFDAFVQGALTKLQGTNGSVTIKSYTPTATGFKICGTHGSITKTHNVTYESANGGLADYVEGTGCA